MPTNTHTHTKWEDKGSGGPNLPRVLKWSVSGYMTSKRLVSVQNSVMKTSVFTQLPTCRLPRFSAKNHTSKSEKQQREFFCSHLHAYLKLYSCRGLDKITEMLYKKHNNHVGNTNLPKLLYYSLDDILKPDIGLFTKLLISASLIRVWDVLLFIRLLLHQSWQRLEQKHWTKDRIFIFVLVRICFYSASDWLCSLEYVYALYLKSISMRVKEQPWFAKRHRQQNVNDLRG